MLVVETFKARLQSQEQFQGICTLIPKLQTPASLEKTLMLGKTEGKRRRGRQRKTGKLGMLWSMGSQRVGHDLATEQRQRNPGLLRSTLWNRASVLLNDWWEHQLLLQARKWTYQQMHKKKLGDSYKWPRDAASTGKRNPWQNRKWRLMPTRKHGLQSHSLKDTVTLRLSQHPDARNCICSFGEKCKVRLQVQSWLQNKTRVSHMHARVCSWLSVQLWGWVYLSVWDDMAWDQCAKGWGVSTRRPGKSLTLFWSGPP